MQAYSASRSSLVPVMLSGDRQVGTDAEGRVTRSAGKHFLVGLGDRLSRC